MKQKKIFAFLCAIMIFSQGTALAEEEEEDELVPGEASAKVSVITMDKDNSHWTDMGQAAIDRAEEYNKAGSDIEVTWTGTTTDDAQDEVVLINQAVKDGADYIAVSCIDADACEMALNNALDAGVTLIYIDSPADVKSAATYATDNYEGGYALGEYLIGYMEEEGVTEGIISIVDSRAENSACQDRYDGFTDAFTFTDFEIGDREYYEGDQERGKAYATAMINNGAVAIFGTDGGATESAVQAALEEKEESGRKIYVVGWDSEENTVSEIENGDLLAFVSQNPARMGSMAIDAVVSMENGEEMVGQVADTGITIYTAENIDEFE